MSSKSVQELIALLESTSDNVERLPTEVETFISDLELVPSEERFKASHIYWCYMSWVEYNQFKTILPRTSFFKEFKKYFKSGRIGKFRYYNVYGEKLRLSRLEQRLLLQDYREERKHRQWLKNREKKET